MNEFTQFFAFKYTALAACCIIALTLAFAAWYARAQRVPRGGWLRNFSIEPTRSNRCWRAAQRGAWRWLFIGALISAGTLLLVAFAGDMTDVISSLSVGFVLLIVAGYNVVTLARKAAVEAHAHFRIHPFTHELGRSRRVRASGVPVGVKLLPED